MEARPPIPERPLNISIYLEIWNSHITNINQQLIDLGTEFLMTPGCSLKTALILNFEI